MDYSHGINKSLFWTVLSFPPLKLPLPNNDKLLRNLEAALTLCSHIIHNPTRVELLIPSLSISPLFSIVLVHTGTDDDVHFDHSLGHFFICELTQTHTVICFVTY